MEHKKMKILILGANGFIGNALVKALLSSNAVEIFGLDLDDDKLEHSIDNPSFNFLRGDINITNEWIEYHISICDVIIPLVAIATPNVYVKDPLAVFELDFEANLKIVKWVAKYNKRLIFPSTSEVYGMCNDEIFNEYSSHLVLGPVHKSRWIYSAAKQLLDRVIIAYGAKHKLAYTLFRPFNWIGARLDSLERAQLGNGRVVSIFVYNLLHNKPLVLVDGGDQMRSFTYIDDGIAALKKIIFAGDGSLNGKIFNIGAPNNCIPIKELAEIVISEYENIFPGKFNAGVIEKPQQEFYGEGYEDIPFRVPDISEAKRMLGWEPEYDAERAIRMTVRSYLTDLEDRCGLINNF